MTTPRREVYEPDRVGVYHCISRCVRRAFLCGFDSRSGISFEHRRAWVRDRLAFLVEVFSIEIVAYAVMSNHLHTLIRNRPDLASKWSAREVAIRWRKLFCLRWENGRPASPNEEEIAAISNNPALVTLYRERLGNISWFNRCLCEHIARRANKEDDCTGRFWEGRFKSQPVYDVSALLACSVYIDLNPIRAGSASTPEESDFTSIQDRIRERPPTATKARPFRLHLVPIEVASEGWLSADDYRTLVEDTGRCFLEGRNKVSDEASKILCRVKIQPRRWLDTTTNYRLRFRKVVGPVQSLIDAAERVGKKWFHGLASARAAFF